MPGKIIYRGPSQIDGAPIVVVAVWASTNRKTGDMLQTYILRSDMHPVDAVQSGADESICGDCKHRQGQGGACYVNLSHGPSSVWRALQHGSYADATDRAGRRAVGAGRMVRLGTYGDPMAVPVQVWVQLTGDSLGWTGYTHQWLNPAISESQRDRVLSFCMASADTEAEAEMAQSMGYRTFRVRAPEDRMLPGEFTCPASEEAGKRKVCATCKACDGSRAGRERQASATIIVHGTLARRFVSPSI